MGQITNTPSLRVEDFDKQQSWIGKLFFQLNPYFQSLVDLLTQNITFGDNIRSLSKDFSISTFQQFSLSWTFTTPPLDVRVIRAVKGTNSTPTILLASWNYDPGTKLITIYGLTEVLDSSVAPISGSTYQFTVRATV